jgi:hypothetical protein
MCGALYSTYTLLSVYSKLNFLYHLFVIFFSQVIMLLDLLALSYFPLLLVLVHFREVISKLGCGLAVWNL